MTNITRISNLGKGHFKRVISFYVSNLQEKVSNPKQLNDKEKYIVPS